MCHVGHKFTNIGHVGTPCQTGAWITINTHRRWFPPTFWVDPPSPKKEMVDMIATWLCEECPLIKQCASSALTGGDTIDGGFSSCASGVIQAGVYLSLIHI